MRRSRSRLALFVALSLVGLTAADAAAQERAATIASDRPGIGDGAWVLASGAWQVELGAAVLDNGGTSVALGQGLLRVGLPGFEVRIYPNSLVVGDAGEGLQDLGVGVKVPFKRGDSRMSLVAGATIPTGTDQATADESTLFGTTVWEWPVTERVGLNVNAGYSFPVDDLADGAFLLTVTPGVSLGEGVSAYGGLAALLGNGDDVLLEAGLARLINENTQVDLNLGLSLNDGTSFVGVGLAVR